MEYSFIIPVFNCKDYLSCCVESICAVQASSYEILLVDDGSTDGSEVLCDDLAAKYPVVRVVHQPNSGASAARNRGIWEARGEKILFLDADDSIDSKALGEILADPRCDQADLTIFGLTFDYYRKGKCYRQDPLCYPYDGILSKQDWGRAFRELYEQNSLSPVWNKVFKRSILKQHRLELNTDMFLYEDFEFVLRYLRYCGNIWNVPQAIYHYRQSEDEGNAKRRLARIDNISDFLYPIEMALTELLGGNSAFSPKQASAVLQQLYLVLAREKISVSNADGVRMICRNFCQWSENHELPMEASNLQKHLLAGHVATLLFMDKKTVLRHKIAVWAKSHHLYR